MDMYVLSSQFITDKFLYDQSVAMDSLLECGLKEQLFELAKVKDQRMYMYMCSGLYVCIVSLCSHFSRSTYMCILHMYMHMYSPSLSPTRLTTSYRRFWI